MLKKIAFAVITSGLLLVPLGASAAHDSFPVCNGADCATMPHDDTKKDIVTASESKKQISK